MIKLLTQNFKLRTKIINKCYELRTLNYELQGETKNE